MPNTHSPISDAFTFALKVELEKHPDGIGEYDLLQILKDQGYFEILKGHPLPHDLFRAHFILFHALYKLRDEGFANEQYFLIINTLKIKLLPYIPGEKSLNNYDSLRDYYLDQNNLVETTSDDVYELLSSFWKKFKSINNRQQALAELDLTDPVEDSLIKKTYRQLIMIHHPDRGGDKDKLQALNAAIEILLG